MCLIVKLGCKPEIAQKDIVCYKLVDSCGVNGWKSFCNYSKHVFKWNEVETARNRFYSRIYNCWEERTIQSLSVVSYRYGVAKDRIDAGFHAQLKKIFPKNGARERICVIPKGTEYCLGQDNDIVAVNMIVFRSMLGYYWYRIKKLW